MIFYGWLLFATPVFSGLIRGRLPVEISTRGAKFAEGADRSADLNETDIRRLERTVSYLADDLVEARAEIHKLKRGDGT
jgi:hypothetical protein